MESRQLLESQNIINFVVIFFKFDDVIFDNLELKM